MLRRLLRLFKRTTIVIPGADQLPKGEGKTVPVGDLMNGGLQILICRTQDGKIHALDSECPHGEGGRLTPGPLMDGQYAFCPLHSYLFDPANGKVIRGSCSAAKTFRATEEGGEIRIRI